MIALRRYGKNDILCIIMQFDVSYRSKDGQLEMVRIEAESRQALFPELAKRGISAIRIQDATGKGKPTKARLSKSAGHARSSSLMRGFLAGAIVVVAAFGIWYIIIGLRDKAQQTDNGTEKPAKIAEVTPAIVAKPKAEEPAPEPTPTKPEPPPFVKRPGALQLPNGTVITFRPPPPGQEKTVWVHGRKYIADSEGNFYDASPVPTFDNRFENTMEAMSAVGGGVLPAAALSIPKDDIVKYLSSPIVINDNDSEDIVEKKIATAEMKELLKDYIKDGGNWEDFVMELSNIKRNERMLQSQAISEIAKMLREGDEEGAQMYRARVDEFMKSKGYRGLKVPEKWGLGELPVSDDGNE